MARYWAALQDTGMDTFRVGLAATHEAAWDLASDDDPSASNERAVAFDTDSFGDDATAALAERLGEVQAYADTLLPRLALLDDGEVLAG